MDDSSVTLSSSVNTPTSFIQRLRQSAAKPVSKSSSVNSKLSSSSSSTQNSFTSSSLKLSNQVNSIANETLSSASTSNQSYTIPQYRLVQLEKILSSENVDLKALRQLCWNGIPPQYRTISWQLMLGYMPTNKSRRDAAITRKRKEYADAVTMYFNVSDSDRTTQEGEIHRQILVDLPRTSPHTPLYQQAPIQRCMERILYIWSVRHPASGYVQGLDDLLTPLIYICLAPYVKDADVLRCDVASISPSILTDVEADTYWCLTKLLDSIQDHYTFSQPGLQRMVLRLEDLIHRLDNDLHSHIIEQGVQYIQFSFRWMNCLLLRELPLRTILRVWDTYLAEDQGGFENFHVYVCVVVMKTFQEKLITMDFQELLMFLQDIPTSSWTESDVEPILSQAYILSTLFENSPNHLY